MPQALFWLALTLIGTGTTLLLSSNNQTTTPPATESVATFDIQSFLLVVAIAGAIALVTWLILKRRK